MLRPLRLLQQQAIRRYILPNPKPLLIHHQLCRVDQRRFGHLAHGPGVADTRHGRPPSLTPLLRQRRVFLTLRRLQSRHWHVCHVVSNVRRLSHHNTRLHTHTSNNQAL